MSTTKTQVHKGLRFSEGTGLTKGRIDSRLRSSKGLCFIKRRRCRSTKFPYFIRRRRPTKWPYFIRRLRCMRTKGATFYWRCWPSKGPRCSQDECQPMGYISLKTQVVHGTSFHLKCLPRRGHLQYRQNYASWQSARNIRDTIARISC